MKVDEDIDNKIDLAIKFSEDEKDRLEKRKPRPFWNILKKRDNKGEEDEEIPTFTIMKNSTQKEILKDSLIVANNGNIQKVENLIEKHKTTIMKK